MKRIYLNAGTAEKPDWIEIVATYRFRDGWTFYLTQPNNFEEAERMLAEVFGKSLPIKETLG